MPCGVRSGWWRHDRGHCVLAADHSLATQGRGLPVAPFRLPGVPRSPLVRYRSATLSPPARRLGAMVCAEVGNAVMPCRRARGPPWRRGGGCEGARGRGAAQAAWWLTGAVCPLAGDAGPRRSTTPLVRRRPCRGGARRAAGPATSGLGRGRDWSTRGRGGDWSLARAGASPSEPPPGSPQGWVGAPGVALRVPTGRGGLPIGELS